MGPCFRRDDVRREFARMTFISPSLPRRDDLDLVAVLERGLGPAALRQHVVIDGDRKMRALIFELAEQRVEPLSRASPLTITRIASPRCRSGRGRHRPASA